MKSFRICKSTVSMILALIMLVSMCTVAFVNVSAAEADVAETGANIPSGTVLYLDPGTWNTSNPVYFCHVFKSGTNTTADYKATLDSESEYYKVTVSGSNFDSYLWVRMPTGSTSLNWDTKWNQTNDISYNGSHNLCKITGWDQSNFECSTYAPPEKFPFTMEEDDERGLYFVNTSNWSNVYCHSWIPNGDGSTWPGVELTSADKVGTYNGHDVYYYSVPSGRTMVIFNNNSGTQTGDLNFEKHSYYDANGRVGDVEVEAGDPNIPFEPESYEYIAFRDDDAEVYSNDPNVYISFDDGEKDLMTKTVDAMSGHDMWVYKKPATAPTTVKFIRSDLVNDSAWTTWTATYSDCTTGLYRATDRSNATGTGSWGTEEHPYAVPDKEDLNNFSFGIWADSRGEGNAYDAVIAEKKSNNFYLYLPSNAPASVNLYTSFASLKIDGTEVTDGSAFTFDQQDETYDIEYRQTQYDAETKIKEAKLRVIRSGDVNDTTGDYRVSTLFLNTNRPLYTKTAPSFENRVSDYKDGIETKGSIYLYDEKGELVNSGKDQEVLKKIKGRGNSSFEASIKLYGKYAYNFNLDKKVSLVKGANKTKKWCLLANNVDHSMIRNTFAYNLANDIGLTFSPKTRHVDVYNNGYYIGAYTIIEKVEYGKDTLMAEDANGNEVINLDDENVDANSVFTADGEDYLYEFDTDDLNDGIVEENFKVNGKIYKYKYYATYDRPQVKDKETGVELVAAADNLTFETPADYRKCNYLLEHELSSRFKAEASWFVTPKGQPVVVKYPEFATKAEMEWIISEYAAMEQAVYDDNYDDDEDGYSYLIDVDSFAKMYLIQELALNLDSCATSYYIHNEFTDDDRTESKLVAGPVWDYDWSFGSYANGGSGRKYVFDGSSTVKENDYTMAYPKQMFIKKKAIKTDSEPDPDSGVNWENNYNLQAKMAQNDEFWIECQRNWTNKVEPAIKKYIDTNTNDDNDTGVMLTQWLPQVKYSTEMNYVRWDNKLGWADGWGTKNTANYSKGSGITNTSNFKYSDTSSSGSASAKSYENTVYYLNDWIAVRTAYMSTGAGEDSLYNEELLTTIEITDVSFEAVQSDNKSQVTVTPSATVTDKDGELPTSDYFYTIYLNGEEYGEPIPFSTPSTVVDLVADKTNTITIYITVKDSDEDFLLEEEKTFDYFPPKYTVTDVAFTAVQSEDDATLAVTPSATVMFGDDVLAKADYQYTIYLNDEAVAQNIPFTTATTTINLADGKLSNVYVKVSPIADTTVYNTSATKTYAYNVDQPVELTIKFKSSKSIRYVPKLTVDGEEYSLTKSEFIIANSTQTEEYYWYTTTIEAQLNDKVELLFTNKYAMRATATIAEASQATYYFGVDNLNNGTTAVQLPGSDDASSQAIRNFVKSAAHMVYNDATDAGIAMTSINSTSYKMGDVDGDDTLSVMDATRIQLALAEKTELDKTGKALADYDLDGDASIMDASCIQTYLVQ